jgi:hypothetical protein
MERMGHTSPALALRYQHVMAGRIMPSPLPWVLVVEMMGLEPTTPCLQSQIGRCGHLRLWETAQVEAALALSVIVRWGPVRTL